MERHRQDGYRRARPILPIGFMEATNHPNGKEHLMQKITPFLWFDGNAEVPFSRIRRS
jgi:hypothetical protein